MVEINIPNNSVTKRTLWRYVNKKIKRVIHHYRVFNVIDILFDEIRKDLIAGRKINITNFGTIELKNLQARPYFDVNEQMLKISEPHRILRFTLAPKLRNKICEHLDINLTFKDDK